MGSEPPPDGGSEPAAADAPRAASTSQGIVATAREIWADERVEVVLNNDLLEATTIATAGRQ